MNRQREMALLWAVLALFCFALSTAFAFFMIESARDGSLFGVVWNACFGAFNVTEARRALDNLRAMRR